MNKRDKYIKAFEGYSINSGEENIDRPKKKKGCRACLGWDTYNSIEFRSRWADRTFYTDWFMDWMSPFVNFCHSEGRVDKDSLHHIADEEKASVLYKKYVVDMKARGYGIKKTILKLTIAGMFKYGF